MFTFLNNLCLATAKTLKIAIKISADMFAIAGCIIYTRSAVVLKIFIRNELTMTLYFFGNRGRVLTKCSCNAGKGTAL